MQMGTDDEHAGGVSSWLTATFAMASAKSPT